MTKIVVIEKESLTPEEFEKVSQLSINQIIEHYPDLLIKAINNSISVQNIQQQLGLQDTNNRARKCIKDFAEENNIQIPLYKANAHPVNQTKISKEDILKRFVKGDIHLGTKILYWVKKYDLVEYRCAGDECQLTSMVWGSKEVPLELDHINGDNADNRLENLRFLCPICHRLTDTHGGKNKTYKNKALRQCRDCGELKQEGKYCNDCLEKRNNDSDIPNIKVLCEEVKQSSITKVASKYNISRETLGKVVKNPENYSVYPVTKIIKGSYPPLHELIEMIEQHGMKYTEQKVGVNKYSIDRYLERRGIKL